MEYHSVHIPPLLRKVLSGTASLSDINKLVRYAHHFALTRLKQLLASGKLYLQSFPLSLESTALDCIAELFERDSEGVFIELEHFFCVEHHLNELSDDDLIAYFRSLIFTKLHDGIFSLYRENDPVLSKILRNVKSAVQKSNCFVITQVLGMSVIAYRAKEDRKHLPEIPLEKIEQYFNRNVSKANNVQPYLRVIEQMLNDEKEYSTTLSLIDVCVAIKRHLIQCHSPLSETALKEDPFLYEDATLLIDKTLLYLRKQLYKRFVIKNKLSEKHFSAYINAISCMVKDTFLLNDGTEKRYGDYLQQQLPEITYDEYRLLHRKQFEYMAKLIKKEVRERLRELL